MSVRPWFGGRLLVSRAGNVFDAQGNITDAAVRQQLEQYLQGFVGFVKS